MDNTCQTDDTWHKVERGIRYREHPTKKHGVPRRLDRYYVIRIAVDGVMRQEALWSKRLQPRIGDIPLVELTPAALDQVKIAMMSAGKSASTIKYCLAVVSQMPILTFTRNMLVNGRDS